MAEHIWRDERYNRQVAVPTFGERGQQMLGQARVCVVGAGGVKSWLLYQLAALGIGTIRIIDSDRVELSNLNRQILYTVADIGKYKAEAAVAALSKLNPDIAIEAVVESATADTYDRLFDNYHWVVEGGNSHANRLEFNRWAVSRRRNYIHASAHFNYCYAFTVLPGRTACYECFYGDIEPAPPGPVPILSTATAMAGAIAASELLNVLLDRPATLAGAMWAHQGWNNQTITVNLTRRQSCPACGHLQPMPKQKGQSGFVGTR